MIEILWLNCVKKLNLIIKVSGRFLEGPVIQLSNPDSPGVNNTPSSRKISLEKISDWNWFWINPNYSETLPESLSEPIRIISNESESIGGPLIFNANFYFESTLQWGKNAFESKAFLCKIMYIMYSNEYAIELVTCLLVLIVYFYELIVYILLEKNALDSIAFFLSVTPIWNSWNTRFNFYNNETIEKLIRLSS